MNNPDGIHAADMIKEYLENIPQLKPLAVTTKGFLACSLSSTVLPMGSWELCYDLYVYQLLVCDDLQLKLERIEIQSAR